MLLLCYFAVFTAASAIVIATGMHAGGLSNQNPLWKFVLGFNPNTKGGYSNEDATNMFSYYKKFGISESLFSYERNTIRERLSVSISSLLKLFIEKIKIIWVISDPSLGFGHFRNGGTLNIPLFPVTGKALYDYMKQADTGCARRPFIFNGIGSLIFRPQGGKIK